MSLDEIGQVMGITRERVRQLEVSALKKLRLRYPNVLYLLRSMALELEKSRQARLLREENFMAPMRTGNGYHYSPKKPSFDFTAVDAR